MAKEPKSDYGTPELARRKQAKVQRSGVNGTTLRVRVVDEDMVDALLLKDVITVDQHHTIERFREDLLRGGWLVPRSQNLEPRVSGGTAQEVNENTAFARLRINRAISWLDWKAGKIVRALILGVCLDERYPSGREEEEFIRVGINWLDRFYE